MSLLQDLIEEVLVRKRVKTLLKILMIIQCLSTQLPEIALAFQKHQSDEMNILIITTNVSINNIEDIIIKYIFTS